MKTFTRVKDKLVDLDNSVKDNISNLSDYLIKTRKFNSCILDRPRHNKIIEELEKLKVNIKLITDGDEKAH